MRKGLQPRPKWKKGESGNPSGRPKGIPNALTFRNILEKIGAEVLRDSPFVTAAIKRKFNSRKNITMKNAAMHVVYNAALMGKPWAAQFIIDYTEGKPKIPVALEDNRITIDIGGEIQKEPKEGEEIGTDEDNIDSPDNS